MSNLKTEYIDNQSHFMYCIYIKSVLALHINRAICIRHYYMYMLYVEWIEIFDLEIALYNMCKINDGTAHLCKSR